MGERRDGKRHNGKEVVSLLRRGVMKKEVDTASLSQSCAGDVNLSGKRSSELREKRKDRRVPLADSSHAAHEPQASVGF